MGIGARKHLKKMQTNQDQEITFEQSIENYRRELCKRESLFKIKNSMKGRFRQGLKRYQQTKIDGISTMIGCSWSFFASWIESKFTKGMRWENYGKYWHIDHIEPLAHFDITDQNDMKRAWHYSNLRPLKAAENIKKGAKIVTCQPELLITIV